MAAKFKAEDTVFIVESNRFVREAQIKSCAGGMYLLKFKDSDGGIKLKEHRLFATKEDAEASIRKEEKKPARRSPYDYM